MTNKKKARILSLPNRLGEIVDRPGGMTSQQAVAAASRNVEAMRGEIMGALDELVDQLATAAQLAPGVERLSLLELLANQIITLAGTYGLHFLAETSKRLCDLAMALEGRDGTQEAALVLHIRAVRLFSPRNPPLAVPAAQGVLSELHKVLHHLNVQRMPATGRMH